MIRLIPHEPGDTIAVISGEPTEAELEEFTRLLEGSSIVRTVEFDTIAVVVCSPIPKNPNAPQPWDVALPFEEVAS